MKINTSLKITINGVDYDLVPSKVELDPCQRSFTIPANNFNNWHDESEPCMIAEFFRQEQSKPPWMRSSSCLIACPCWRHRVYC